MFEGHCDMPKALNILPSKCFQLTKGNHIVGSNRKMRYILVGVCSIYHFTPTLIDLCVTMHTEGFFHGKNNGLKRNPKI